MAYSVCLIGHGAVARAVCAAFDGDRDLAIRQILVRPPKRAQVQAEVTRGIHVIDSLQDVASDTDFVLECAGHEAVWNFAAPLLSKGLDLGVLSAGALAREGETDRLKAAARAGASRLVIVPGAIGGIDALAAAGPALSRVCYTARKPPLSWRGSPAETTHDLMQIDAPTVLFQGSARAAALAFPKNANVVATVALAGVGFDNTEVTLIADPQATGNSHQINATGGGYALDFTTSGKALPTNPRTSALTAASAVRTVRHRASGLMV